MVPVEPISLTVGAVALASLFSLCVQCFDLIEVGKNLGSDCELLLTRLSIEKRRLMIWGEAVGILRPDEDREPLLDKPETRELVKRILENLQSLFHEADSLKSIYGLEKTPGTQGSLNMVVEGSTACSYSFESSPLVQFQARFTEYSRKAGLRAKAKWAIRDSKKFSALVQKLKDLLDGLGHITTSTRTVIRRDQLIRQETESIPDLNMLRAIESTCSDSDWKSYASISSTYLQDFGRLSTEKRADIQNWVEISKDPPQTFQRRRNL
ncbi:uncharacterized protein A1O5_10327 [Cladophialophora psammophila CBS 110553]|uniref:Prion-inhibition and propagation HeLo domain-containing protein n=1 Tax=Cladophialophora psammophila CBS 110553 TaxID=1182543 RepID=W9WPQ0_9EURO|nr:uncharacterized protein A1O5_10327 [Cladophialophora psammophila CBS 110553]EXJ66656.1 hypothetical protein A1O5_10327 [Cladophialophora psammophila CBS 110553]